MTYPIGNLVAGDINAIHESRARFERQTVDQVCYVTGNDTGFSERVTTLADTGSVTGPGTSDFPSIYYLIRTE